MTIRRKLLSGFLIISVSFSTFVFQFSTVSYSPLNHLKITYAQDGGGDGGGAGDAGGADAGGADAGGSDAGGTGTDSSSAGAGDGVSGGAGSEGTGEPGGTTDTTSPDDADQEAANNQVEATQSEQTDTTQSVSIGIGFLDVIGAFFGPIGFAVALGLEAVGVPNPGISISISENGIDISFSENVGIGGVVGAVVDAVANATGISINGTANTSVSDNNTSLSGTIDNNTSLPDTTSPFGDTPAVNDTSNPNNTGDTTNSVNDGGGGTTIISDCTPPIITGYLNSTTVVGSYFSYSIRTTGTPPISFDVDSSTLPDGLKLSGSIISGRALDSAESAHSITYGMRINVSNNCGNDTKTLILTVNPSIGTTGIAPASQTTPTACSTIYSPVCGIDGKTYSNSCTASSMGITVASAGKCGAPTVSLSLSNVSVPYGGQTVVTWSSQNANYCIVGNDWPVPQALVFQQVRIPTSGTQTINYIYFPITLSLRCFSADGVGSELEAVSISIDIPDYGH